MPDLINVLFLILFILCFFFVIYAGISMYLDDRSHQECCKLLGGHKQKYSYCVFEQPDGLVTIKEVYLPKCKIVKT